MSEKEQEPLKNEEPETEENIKGEAESVENGENEAKNGEKSKTEKKAEKKKNAEKEIERLTALADDYKRKWYSVSAEYDNYRKRTQTLSSQAYADGKAEAILKLLPVSDNFGYAYASASDDKTRAGIEKIIKNFNTILSSLGIEEIPINVGDDFDESTMEAIMNAPAGDGEKPNTVNAVVKKGYKQGDKVIRFAQVSVTV